MKNKQEVINRLHLELQCWQSQQAHYPDERFYLYYLPSTPEHDSGFSIRRTKPANQYFKLACPEHISGYKTIEENMRILEPIVFNLPILSH